jgi:hypothetical protein
MPRSNVHLPSFPRSSTLANCIHRCRFPSSSLFGVQSSNSTAASLGSVYKSKYFQPSGLRLYTSSSLRPAPSEPLRSIKRTFDRTKFSYRLPRASVRHCSHRRNMCKYSAGLDESSVDISKGREVLPTNVKPLHYHLTLEPNFETFQYEGHVTVEYEPAWLVAFCLGRSFS